MKSLVTRPNDDTKTLAAGPHVARGYAWSGGGAIVQVEVSVDGGISWQPARLEEPSERFMWRRWSWVWDAAPGEYTVMSRATDSVGNVQSHEPRYNNMRKNFSAIVGYDITVE